MKVMFLVPHGTRRSQARYRVSPLVRYWSEKGIDAFWKEMPQGLYARYSFFSRLPHADVVVVHRELLSSYELGIVRRLSRKLVFDCADAVWALPAAGQGIMASRNRLERGFQRMCQGADVCVVDNKALAEEAAKYQDQVHVVTTPIDVEHFVPGNGGKNGGPTLVGWCGNCDNQSYAEQVMGTLTPLAGSVQFSILSKEPYAGPAREYAMWTSWAPGREVGHLQAMDIGLVPVPSDDNGQVANGIEALKLMSVGLPVIASDVGVHAEMIDHGVDGYLVRDEADWAKYIKNLADQPDLRRRMGEQARKKIVENHALDVIAPQLRRVLGV
ncbi:MAG: hypothetical protein CL942_13625 [Desulfovibrio sp.]|nr:hypothetical protein [Desulfovibrio sp.]|tara:strand:- start:12120 stop:13103 length:984 start_codon:yes stop_codon:yes gene_type:complete